MVQVRVFVNNISAERFLDVEKTFPPIQVATNINIVEINKKREDLLEIPFVFAANYRPAVAQLTVRGVVHVTGSSDEVKRIHGEYTKKHLPPPVVIQSISNTAFLESVIIARTLNIPPPIPLPKIPQVKEKKRSEPTYRA